VVIARANKPAVKLVPVGVARKERKFGGFEGMVWTSPDFDEPLADFRTLG
jgi:antitoxin (DNA-binding transcriptional repressor) of toxin-antitoxin stability system